MRRLLIAIASLLLGSQPALAQQTLSCGVPVTSFSAASIVDTTAGTSYALYSNLLYVTWQVSFGTAPSAISVSLQGSLNNTDWVTIDTSTATAGDLRNVAGSYRFVRAYVNSHTDGDEITVTLNCTKQTGGSSGSGYSQVEDEGSAVTKRTTLNFEGTGVECADDTTKTTCTVTGGSSSFPLEGTVEDCTTPDYSFTNLTTGGLCLLSGQVRVQRLTSGAGATGYLNLTDSSAQLNYTDASANNTQVSVANNLINFDSDSTNILQFDNTLGVGFISANGGTPAAARSLTSPSGGMVISNADGASGNPGLDPDDTVWVKYSSGAALPATCTPPELFYETDVFELYTCIDTDTWNYVITQNAPTDDTVMVGSGTAFQKKTLANGILRYATATNAFSAATVAVSELATGTDGELITWDSSGNPATVAVGTSGQVLTSNGAGAAPTFQAASGGGDTLVFKASDETTTSDVTYSDDSTLTFSVSANTSYIFDILVAYTTTATADIKVQVTCPSTPTSVNYFYTETVAATTTMVGIPRQACSQSRSITGTSTFGSVRFTGAIRNGANAGAVTLQWAQDTTDGGNTTVNAGSYIKYRQVP